jgi:hypothetical protein
MTAWMSRHRITLLWCLLVLATLLSLEFGHGLVFGHRQRLAAIAILLIAYLKARVVFLDFMELRHAPLPLRLVFEAWGILASGAIVVLFYSAA